MPYYDIYDDNIRCGRGAATSGPGAQTASVIAGENVTIAIGESCAQPSKQISHEGTGQAYLSHVGDDESLEEYQGDGDWFKIGSIGRLNKTRWILQGSSEVSHVTSSPVGIWESHSTHASRRLFRLR
jgi:hypothetical protein